MSQSGNIRSGEGGGLDSVLTLSGDVGGPVGPDPSGNISISGSSTTYVTGNSGSNNLDVEVVSNANTILLGTGLTTPSIPLGPLNDGQIIIGSTAVSPVISTLTAGSNITITNGPGSITISSTASLGVNRQIFTSSGTYTPTANMVFCIVEAVGGGGGGGGADVFTNPLFVVAGSGGGSGGYANGLFSAGTIGASQSITIGTGGTGAAGSGNGSNGTATLFGSLITCNPGTFGSTNIPDYSGGTQVGGGGGTAIGGDYQITGQRGSGGIGYSFSTTAPIGTPVGTILAAISGAGGSTPLGLGGPMICVGNPGVTASIGFDSTGYGSGGGSAASVDNTIVSPLAGGNGSQGIVIVTEYLGSTGSGGSSFSWNIVTTDTPMIKNNGYITNSASPITLNLPTSASVGDIIEVCGENTGGWIISQASGQQIVIGNQVSTLGVLGSLSSTMSTDCVRLVCTVTNNTFEVLSQQGNPSVA